MPVNHCSDQHPWFLQACRSRDDPHHDYFIWAEPRAALDPATAAGLHTGGPPNNWEAAFGGPAWTLNPATGEYFLHLFSPQQPELNWRNPRLRAEVHDILRFWLARGVDGFRMVMQGSKVGVLPAVSPNTGQLRTVGALGTGPVDGAVFDIADLSNAPLAALRSAGRTRLYLLDLATGRARVLGTVDDGRVLWGLAIEP